MLPRLSDDWLFRYDQISTRVLGWGEQDGVHAWTVWRRLRCRVLEYMHILTCLFIQSEHLLRRDLYSIYYAGPRAPPCVRISSLVHKFVHPQYSLSVCPCLDNHLRIPRYIRLTYSQGEPLEEKRRAEYYFLMNNIDYFIVVVARQMRTCTIDLPQ